MLAKECIDEAKALLNDPGGLLFATADLFPYLKKAYRELQSKMFANQIATVMEIATTVVVSIGGKSPDSVPSDMLYPIFLEERLFGSSDLYTDMDERSWEPDEKQTDALRYWVWREETLQFIGATTKRELRVKYAKTLSALADENSSIPVGDSLSFLAARTAALGALYVGENPSRSRECQDEANVALADFIGTRVRRKQATPARHRRNRYRR
jgi:hypothetical protein